MAIIYGEGHTDADAFDGAGEYAHFRVPHRSIGTVGPFVVE